MLFLAAYALLFIVVDVAIWILLDFNPHYREIDYCMDKGGVWDDEKDECEGARTY